ncbi:hypothetical protein F4809DRAFT_292604 [Biscogniauxia mediterranea]|nr:hypothetical protein F4809DRAFT_292604 [Biscogniauxia mediterranea]
MVPPKHGVGPADRLATVNVTLTVSPTLSLSDPDAQLELTLTLRLACSQQEGRPLTLCTQHSVFSVYGPSEPWTDMPARGAFGKLRSCGGSEGGTSDLNPDNAADANRRTISLGNFRVVSTTTNVASDDLRDHDLGFITVPGDGSPVTVTHRLSWGRIFRYEQTLSKADLVPGERFSLAINPSFLGAVWWCWGDIETDHRNKRLHAWTPSAKSSSGGSGKRRPNEDFVRRGNWVLSEAPASLHFEDVTEGGHVTFEIVE